MIQILYFGIISWSSASAVNFSRSDAGFAVGLSFQCPEHLEPAIIPTKSLKGLYISVISPEPTKVTSYDYYHVKNLVPNPGIDFKKRTLFYVNGYSESYYQDLVMTIGRIYRNLGYNVMILNTLEFNGDYYLKAASFVRPIGKLVAEILANLTTVGLDPKKLDLIGHNFGAHTISFIAKNYRQITGRNVSSITALDPAGPCFRHLGPEGRLDASDADFVLTMALNIDGYGMAKPVGHVTFYVNGGEYQPSDIWFIPCGIECSHSKAFFYWGSALLNPHTFLGMQCDSIQKARDGDCYDRKPFVWNSMDLFVDKSKPGIYFLPTFNKYPYGLGKKGLRKKNERIVSYLGYLNKAAILSWKEKYTEFKRFLNKIAYKQ